MNSPGEAIERLVRPELRALSAYHVPETGALIKLDAMENPYPWPAELVEAWLAELRSVSLNRYPDPRAAALKSRMRTVLGVPESAAVVLGNGSDELIQMIIQSVAAPGRVILAPEPTFVMYRQIAAVAGLHYAGVPLLAGFALDTEALVAAVDAYQPAAVFLACPNNPTGNLFEREAVAAIIARAPGLVVIDEAYAPFTDSSYLPELENAGGNLLVLRTLSKIGFAGLRLGLLAGPPPWLEEIEKTRLPYNISTLNQVSGEFALRHYPLFAGQAATLRAEREALYVQLQRLPGLEVFPSAANFLLFRAPHGRARALYEGLKARGILIKNLDAPGSALADCLRVTVGRPEENRAFLAALAGLLG
jgi:histidinol-phosphate aminotransferase